MFRVSFLWPPALRQSNECEMALTQSPVSTRKVQKTLSCLREILILLYFKGYYTSLKNSKAFFISNICRFFPMCFIDLTNGRKFFLCMLIVFAVLIMELALWKNYTYKILGIMVSYYYSLKCIFSYLQYTKLYNCII